MSSPIIRTRLQHSISRRDIDPDALKVVYRLAQAGFTAYIVGGSVRDLLLRRQPKDFDVSTDAHPRQIKRLFRNCFLIGRRFRLAHIKFGDKIIETSTFRRTPPPSAENSAGDDILQREDNAFGTPEEDARRRDFTINGLFYDVEAFCVIDYVGGLADLESRQVRTIGDPNIRFREDPVRMIRATRFAARLDFAIDAATYEAILRHRGEIVKAAPPRLYEEILRLFPYGKAATAFRLLHDTALLDILLPGLAVGDENTDRLWRYLAALDRGDIVHPEPVPALNLAVLFYPAILRLSGGQPGNFRELSQAIEGFAVPLWKHYRVPGRVADQIRRMYFYQDRFSLPPRGHTKALRRFVDDDVFSLALSLAEIRFAAEGRDLSLLNDWRAIYEHKATEGISDYRLLRRHDETAGGDGKAAPAVMPQNATGGRRRRRRRRRGGQKDVGKALDALTMPTLQPAARFEEPSPVWKEEI